jgi:nucleotide-binding universal stress UspA family protein
MHAAQPRASGTAQGTGAARYLRLDRILVPLDFSGSSVDALRFALPFARESGARLELLHVLQPVVAPLGPPGEGTYMPQADNDRLQAEALARLKTLAAVEVRRPVCASVVVKQGPPARVIGDVAGEHIAVPSRVAYYGKRLQLSVLESGMRQLAELTQRVVPPDLESEQLVRAGTPHDIINRVARLEEADLIIVATRGHGALKHFFIGGTAGRVVRHAPCPVLVVR